MKKSLFLSFGYASILLLALSCEKKIDKPAPPPPPAPPAAPKISITTVRGPETKDCGGFQWDVKFTLDKKSPKGGYIVQKITWTPKINNCDGTFKEGPEKVYWEAWEVGAGTDGDKERLAGNFDYDDRYSSPSHPNTKGSLTVAGELVFFEGQVLPATFKKNNADTYAGGLPATTEKPAFWDNKDMVAHNLTSKWICCKDEEKMNEVTTIPKKSGRDMYYETPNTDKLDYYGKLIAKIPAWTDGYNAAKSFELYNISRQLSSVSLSNLKNSIAIYTQVFAGTQDEIAAMSKVYLLLRALYQLPNAMPRNHVKVFGGFIHPSIDNTQMMFDMSYPMESFSLSVSESPIQVTGEYRGFLGRGYDAVGEIDYFNQMFQRRKF